MRKVFHFDSPREKYQCDAVILWCYDNRFELAFRKFLSRIGIVHSDPIKIAGGAKSLASPSMKPTASLFWIRSANPCACTAPGARS